MVFVIKKGMPTTMKFIPRLVNAIYLGTQSKIIRAIKIITAIRKIFDAFLKDCKANSEVNTKNFSCSFPGSVGCLSSCVKL